ncbi:MAG: hypothetical protein A2W00_02010 [Candidatus Eisenbacteria bacterium RBG_16_71_46]|nr:MAG: hypothetical protein A2W00_02010 [Candidatus Eisenbacteria bacterium RBG_16_71_46]
MVVPDLFFASRIEAVAQATGIALVALGPRGALEACRSRPPDLLILDLHAPGDPFGLVRALKQEPATRAIEIAGFYSHVDVATREAAQSAGVDRVLPRSAFTKKLPELLRGD